jgi:undecaprenyl-diphosphatase
MCRNEVKVNVEWDYTLFRYINDYANNTTLLGISLVNVSAWSDYFFFLSLVVFLFFRFRMAVYGFAAACFTVAASRAISFFYYRNRPFMDFEVNQLLYHIDSNSFPSDHAAAAVAIAVMLRLFSPRIGRIYLILAALVCFSRVWVGVHYPFDVMIGMLVGITAALACYHLLEKTELYNKGMQFLRAIARRKPANGVEL